MLIEYYLHWFFCSSYSLSISCFILNVTLSLCNIFISSVLLEMIALFFLHATIIFLWSSFLSWATQPWPSPAPRHVTAKHPWRRTSWMEELHFYISSSWLSKWTQRLHCPTSCSEEKMRNNKRWWFYFLLRSSNLDLACKFFKISCTYLSAVRCQKALLSISSKSCQFFVRQKLNALSFHISEKCGWQNVETIQEVSPFSIASNHLGLQ